MYRIRLVSGKEQVYPSIQELTAGVQRGEVTAEAEIYHQRSERWLSIESHPHFRMALEGGTATRTSRLKFTRPASPVATTGVRPTPVAQKPDQGDLEELNRLLVLLDPLPTPAQRAEPAPSNASAPPALTLVRPEPVQPADVSDESGQTFGTMLRLEDLEPPPAPEKVDLAPVSLDVIRDERVLADEAVVEEPIQRVEPIAAFEAEPAPSDLGLPIEIHLDEIPVPIELERVELSTEVGFAAEPVVVPTAAVEVASEEMEMVELTVSAPTTPEMEYVESEPRHEAAFAVPARRRARPMLFVGAVALLAAVVFAFTSGGSDADKSMVTPASATVAVPPVVSVPETTSPSVTPTSNVGFPMPAPGKGTTSGAPTAPAATASRDSEAPAGLLPSAPMIDLSTGGTELVSAGSAAPSTGAKTGSELARGYTRSYQNLENDFQGEMDRSGMVRLFSQTQLTTNDGLAGARRALDAAATAMQRYHARETTIEKAYQDSARALERSGATPADLRDWMTHTSLKETREAADEGARLGGQIDAVFALLQAQSGRYKVDGSTIHFENADASARYAELQGWITRRLEHWAGQPASSVPTTVQPLLEGIGLTRLPTSR